MVLDDTSAVDLKMGDKVRDQREANLKRTVSSKESMSKENQPEATSNHQTSQPSFFNPRQPSVYQKQLKYVPNTNFSGNKSSLLVHDNEDSPQPSVPNTFHHKSHPNARSKELGGSRLVDDDQHSSLHQSSHFSKIFPQGVPEELNEKWTQPSTTENPSTNSKDNFLNQKIRSMEFQPSSTVIHNSDIQMNENLPWRSAIESPAGKNLQDRFHDSKEMSNKETTASSVTSTPVGTTRRVSSTLYPVAIDLNQFKPVSPLKLFKENYDTYTRDKLEGVLQGVSKANTPAQANVRPDSREPKLQKPALIENLQASNIPPKLSIKDFTKTDSYTTNAYKENAENLFSKLVQKGHKWNIERMRSVSKETATSTPKRTPLQPVDDHDSHYASFSTGYSSEGNSVPVDAVNENNRLSNEFTSITNDSESRSEMKVDEMNSDVTFESQSEMVEELDDMQRSMHTQDFELGGGKLTSSRTLESDQLDQLESLNMDGEIEDTMGTIKLKPINKLRSDFITPLVNGKMEPDICLSHDYPGMFFDPVNLKWISTDSQNKTLDNIADLTDNEVELPGILKKENSKMRKNNFEVSFQEPNSFSQSFDKHEDGVVVGDVTKLSQLVDTSFSESRKKLVSTLNRVLELKLGVSSWQDVEETDLSRCELSSLVDLFEFLPKLKKLNAAGNHIKYLAGLPHSIVDLDLSGNEVEDRSSFRELRDLHRLTLDHNILTETTNFSRNINLTVLKLSHNKIDDISGLQKLSNLFYLDLSFNKLKNLNMKRYELTNLQELNVSNNLIETIESIDHLLALRILNCNKNRISKVDCANTGLRKLLINQNNLNCLDLKGMRQLLCVKFDGNVITQLEFPRRNLIERASMKSQPYMSRIWGESVPLCDQLRSLDLSGNRLLPNCAFPFINELTLSAMNLTHLPANFAKLFPNVQYLNLNFNKLESIEPLSPLASLKKVWLVSNNLTNFYLTLKHLKNSSDKLVLLDQRLNSFNGSFYDFVFTPNEAEVEIDLATVEDIEVFTERLDELNCTHEWEARDEAFQQQLETRREMRTIKAREVYQSSTIMFFKRLRTLDGIHISNAYRYDAYVLYRKLFPKGG